MGQHIEEDEDGTLWCEHCGLEVVDDWVLDDDPELCFEVCRCEICDVCGEDTHGGMASCACDRDRAREQQCEHAFEDTDDGRSVCHRCGKELVHD